MRLPSPFVRTLSASTAILAAVAARHVGDSKQIPICVVAVTVIAIVGSVYGFPALVPRTLTIAPRSESGRRLVLGALLFVLPTLGAVLIWRTEPFSRTHEFVQTSSTAAAILWLFGLVAGLAVLWESVPDRPHVDGRMPAAFIRSNSARVLVLLILILVVGAAVRLWHLSSLPEGIWSDEADSAADSVRMQHVPFQAFAPGNYGHNPALYFYAMAALVRIGGNNIEMARLTSAVFGIAGIAVVFGLGYQLVGAVLGLYAASLMAMAQWAITFSRIALPNIPVPAITGLGYVAFMIAMHRPRPFWFALSGILLGLSFLTYPGAYLPAIVPVLLLYVRSRTDPEFAQASRFGRLFLLLGLPVAAAPMLTALFLDGNYVLGRVHVTSLFNEYHDATHRVLGLLDNVRSYAFMLTVQGDRNGRHNLSGSPMLDPITGVLFLLGLGVCLRQWRHWQYQVLVLWLGSNLLSGILSLESEAPHGPRTLGALAPVVVIAALPLLYLGPIIQKILKMLRTRRSREKHSEPTPGAGVWGIGTSAPATRISSGIAATILVCAFMLNLDQYFRKQANSVSSWEAMGGQITIIARSVARLNREGNHVYTNELMMNDIVMQFVAPSWKPEAYNASRPLSGLATSGRIIFIIPVQEQRLVQRLKAELQNIQIVTLMPRFSGRTVEGYVVSWQARHRSRVAD